MTRIDGAIESTVSSAISWIARSVTPPLPPPRLMLMSCACAGDASAAAAIREARNEKLYAELSAPHEDDDFGRPSERGHLVFEIFKAGLRRSCGRGGAGGSARIGRGAGGGSGATGGAMFSGAAGRRRAASRRCAISARFWSALGGCGAGGGGGGGGGAAARSRSGGAFGVSIWRAGRGIKGSLRGIRCGCGCGSARGSARGSAVVRASAAPAAVRDGAPCESRHGPWARRRNR